MRNQRIRRPYEFRRKDIGNTGRTLKASNTDIKGNTKTEETSESKIAEHKEENRTIRKLKATVQSTLELQCMLCVP